MTEQLPNACNAQLGFAEYHNIVKIDNDKFANDVLQHIIHDVLNLPSSDVSRG